MRHSAGADGMRHSAGADGMRQSAGADGMRHSAGALVINNVVCRELTKCKTQDFILI